jgi:hypothetical protein
MDFPSERFAQAGATPEEIARLKEAFDASSESAQASQLEHLAGISTYDIAEQLVASRSSEDLAGEEGGAEPSSGPDPVLGVASPADAGQGKGPAVEDLGTGASGK